MLFKKNYIVIIPLLLICPISGMGIDLFSPALPHIQSKLHISHQYTKAVIYLYVFGFSLGSLIMGILTDAYGRKKLLRVSLLFFALFSILPIIFPNIHILLLSRFGQGFFIASLTIIARAVFIDILSSKQLIRIGPIISALWGLGPIIGPIIGGYLVHYYNWTSGFYLFSIISILLTILLFIVYTETAQNFSPISNLKSNIKTILVDKEFLLLVSIQGLSYSLIIIFNTLGPFIIQNKMGHNAIYFGKLNFIAGITFLIATFISRWLLNYFNSSDLFKKSLWLLTISAMIVMIFSFYFTMNLISLMFITLLSYFCCGFYFPLSLGKSMTLFKNIPGTAVAIIYCLNNLITAFISTALGLIYIQSTASIIFMYGLLMFSIAILIGCCLTLYRKK
jgi:MFS transporter, DHA1 family, multidrug resistance protein